MLSKSIVTKKNIIYNNNRIDEMLLTKRGDIFDGGLF